MFEAVRLSRYCHHDNQPHSVKAKFRCPGQSKAEKSALCQERTLLRVPRVNEMELDQYAKLKIEVRNQKALNRAQRRRKIYNELFAYGF